MGAVTEGEVPGGPAADVEPVGAGEPARVPVGGLYGDGHRLPRPDQLALHLDVLQRGPQQRVGHAEIAQQLLRGRSGEIRVGAQGVQLTGVGQQGEDAEAEHVRRGVEPGGEEQPADPGQLLVAEAGGGGSGGGEAAGPGAGCGAGRGEVAEQVVGGLGPLGEDEFTDVPEQPRVGLVPGPGVDRLVEDDLDQPQKAPPVGVGHAEQLADHQRGQGPREGLDQVGRGSGPLHGVQAVGGEPLDTTGQLTHPAHGEATGEQSAVAGVLRGVEAEDVPDGRRRQFPRRAFHRHRQVQEFVAGAEARIGQHRAGRRVPGDQPAHVPVGVTQTADGPVAQRGERGGRIEGAADVPVGGQDGQLVGGRGVGGRFVRHQILPRSWDRGT